MQVLRTLLYWEHSVSNYAPNLCRGLTRILRTKSEEDEPTLAVFIYHIRNGHCRNNLYVKSKEMLKAKKIMSS
jgi:hypothetical protein